MIIAIVVFYEIAIDQKKNFMKLQRKDSGNRQQDGLQISVLSSRKTDR